MEEIKQNMTIAFADGNVEDFEQFVGYQLGNGFIQVLMNDIVYIFPSSEIKSVIITQGE